MAQEQTSAPVREGDILAGKYRVERVLGVGGMGVVVAATHVQLGQRVALKFLLPSAVDNAMVVARFDQEARAAVRLRSQHVARILDVGVLETGAPYIVMEHLQGVDLSDLVQQRGPLPVEEAADYLLQVCEAIAEAHSLGIIHRDIKPRNLFATQGVDGRPLIKVLDFGISKLATAEGSAALSLTKTTDVIGSPNYMPPEQLRSSRLVDARSDVWSLGVVLFELLSGTVPFDAETLPQLCAMVFQDPPRPLWELRPDTPPRLVEVVERCLQKNPADRFQSVAELAAALEPFVMTTESRSARIVRIQPAPLSNPSLAATELTDSGAVQAVRMHNTRSAPQGTHAPSSSDVPAGLRRQTSPLLVGIGALVGIGLIAGGAVWSYGHATHAPAAASAGSSAPLAATAPAPPSLPVEPVAAVPSAVPAASTVAPVASAAVRPGSKHPAGAATKPATAEKPAPPPAHPGDDLPNVRN